MGLPLMVNGRDAGQSCRWSKVRFEWQAKTVACFAMPLALPIRDWALAIVIDQRLMDHAVSWVFFPSRLSIQIQGLDSRIENYAFSCFIVV